MKWEKDEYQVSRLWVIELLPFSVGGVMAISDMKHNLAVVARQPDGRYFWRVFDALARRLPGEPALTLADLSLDGYMPDRTSAMLRCEQMVKEIEIRARDSGVHQDRLTQSRFILRKFIEAIKIITVLILATSALVLAWAYLIFIVGG